MGFIFCRLLLEQKRKNINSLKSKTVGNNVYNLLLAFCLLAKVLADFLVR